MAEPDALAKKASMQPPPWLPLLQRLSDASPGWGVWKNADQAITISGDIDSVSPPEAVPALLREFSSWASTNNMGPVFICRHLPGSVLTVAVRDRRELVELQLCERAMFRGSTLFTARDLAPLMIMDARGFRRLRPGAEGLLLLFHNAMGRGGRPRLDGPKADRLIRLMREDPEGRESATKVFGSVQEDAGSVAHAALNGAWDRRSARRVELWAIGRGLRDVRLFAARGIYSLTGGRYCPLLSALRRGRQLEGDVDAWLRRAFQTH